MQSVHTLLDMLQGVKGNGPKYTARCPGHDDNRNSLSVTEGDDGAILVKCHAGCETQYVLGVLDLKMADLYIDGTEKGARRVPKEKREVIKRYVYKDAEGKDLFRVCRTHPKGFYQERPVADHWETGLGRVKPVPYHLPEIIQAVGNSDVVHICEGEKDADNLWGIGLVATTAPMGAGKWRTAYNKWFKGARVVIWADNDKAGQEHAAHIALCLYPDSFSIKMPVLPDGLKDVSDFLAQGRTLDDIDELMAAAPPYEPPDDSGAVPAATSGFSLTDLGNAERFREHWKDVARYCYERKRWLIWSGKVWIWDAGALCWQLATQTIRSILAEASKVADDDARNELIKHAMKSESHNKITAMVDAAKGLGGLQITVADVDRQPFLFNCANGTIDLLTGDLMPHRRKDMITQMCPIEFDRSAAAPRWLQFLAEVTENNTDIQGYLQRAMGYSLTGDTTSQVLFFLYGQGLNGKSTFLTVARRLMSGYACKTATDMFLHKERSGPSEDLANLQGRRLVVASEIEEGRRLHVTLVKEMTGGESIRADRKYEHEIEFMPEFKIWIAGNHKPTITDVTMSIWRRVKLIPFTVTIPDADVDSHLTDKLTDELSGILLWAVQGCLEWQRIGLFDPPAIRDATERYRRDQDILNQFMEDECILDPQARVTKADLKEAYVEHASRNGYKPVSQQTMKQKLEDRGVYEQRDGKTRYWRGIRLRMEGEDPQADTGPVAAPLIPPDSTAPATVALFESFSESFRASVLTAWRELGSPATTAGLIHTEAGLLAADFEQFLATDQPITGPQDEGLRTVFHELLTAAEALAALPALEEQPVESSDDDVTEVTNMSVNSGNYSREEKAKKSFPSLPAQTSPLSQTDDDVAALLGMTIEQACERWEAMGCPMIPLRKGETTRDLRLYLQRRPLVDEGRFAAIRQFLAERSDHDEER